MARGAHDARAIVRQPILHQRRASVGHFTIRFSPVP
jgi:hypothetical protein